MAEQSIQTLNLIAFCDLKYPDFCKSVQTLEETLHYLRQGDRLTFCYANEIFSLVRADLALLIEALERAIDWESNFNISDELLDRRDDLKELLIHTEELEQHFQPFLYCPAKES